MKLILHSFLVKTDINAHRSSQRFCLLGLANFKSVIQHSENLLLLRKIQNITFTILFVLVKTAE
jgi:hypothetical protein